MTEYGRGQGSEPWHPDDPLYGDGGWGGQQAQQGQQFPHDGQPQHYPQQPQAQQQYGDWGTTEQDGYGQPQQQYPQYEQQYGQQYAPQQQPQQQYDTGGWHTGAHSQDPYAAGPTDPYGQQTGAYGGGRPTTTEPPTPIRRPSRPAAGAPNPNRGPTGNRAPTRASTPSSREAVMTTTTATTTATTRATAGPEPARLLR
ncbi:hypothetical protein SGRIM128S_04873 [Streptomyces griseomycini]